jgi:hypothetical protein
LPGYNARAAFTVNSSSVFKEDIDTVPIIIDDTLSYMPWGADNQMVCYGSGLQYNCSEAANHVREEVENFMLDNDLEVFL